MMSRTPPTFTPGSYEPTHFKRQRAGSISGRLRSASDLCDDGIITPHEKGLIKDLIITGDPELERVLETYEARGRAEDLTDLLRGGTLQKRRQSIDLADDLDLGVLNVGSLGSVGSTGGAAAGAFNFDDIPFNPDMDTDMPMAPDRRRRSRADSFGDVLGSSFGLGLGSFSFGMGSMGVPASTSMTGRGMGGGSTASAAAAAASTSAFPASPLGRSFDGLLGEDEGEFPGFPLPEATTMRIEQQPARPAPGAVPAAAPQVDAPPAARAMASAGRPRPAPPSGRAVSDPIAIRLPGRGATTSGSGGRKIGAYSPKSRKLRVQRFLEKRQKRVWTKKVKYDVRKNFADSRLRVKGRFVKKEDEAMLRELIQMT